ncbi:xanthine dehydrogenase family protein molybdopterin-binding subunit [Mangrovicoccus ximenensis]|uniref:xanthine dehydrogenase family protein molybdopterin-binding subunit n=1 Tax=Mangrovicoccus ximenensis TaxID=1911570 RepID=UPI001F216A67|nr:xanthine dehydrogenase family protein molybdopterin-binding subunit [Mangrovicoccus ximenensis]
MYSNGAALASRHDRNLVRWTSSFFRLAAGADGRLAGIWHEAASYCLPGGRGENATAQTPVFYAGGTRRVKNHVVDMALPESADMRAPGEASGLMALEVAMDEMAEKLGIDPVEFRILNDTQVHPSQPDTPFSDRNFADCLRRGAEEFGWEARNREPGATRDGDWMVGHGVAGAYRGHLVLPSGARARLAGGKLVIETDMTDIGTGSYTILAQTAAETMGMAAGDVEVRLGNSAYPVSSGSGGQFGAPSSTAGVYAACMALRARIAERLGLDDPEFRGGRVIGGDGDRALAEIEEEVSAEDAVQWGEFQKGYAMATFGAHFVEVGVHAYTGETRVRRMLAVCDAGRIVNPVTARSQVIGAMAMGVGAALSEEMALDTGRGVFANHDMASYEVAVHADIPEQQVIFLDTADAAASPLKAKGVGELGLCGVPAAIANAVHNATGIRVRDYPVTPERLIGGLPEIG